jgi:hypothetical protein
MCRFSLAFGDSVGGVIGNPWTYMFYRDVTYAPDPRLCPTVPLVLFSVFHMKFALITPAIVSGEGPWFCPWWPIRRRVRLLAFSPFSFVLSQVVGMTPCVSPFCFEQVPSRSGSPFCPTACTWCCSWPSSTPRSPTASGTPMGRSLCTYDLPLIIIMNPLANLRI